MEQDLFFKGEIPTLETDQEGKLRGGFCALSNGNGDLRLNVGGCLNPTCGHTNERCSNSCAGNGSINDKCTNKCSPDSSDKNTSCVNECGTTDTGCSHGNTDKECTTPANGQQGIGFSLFNLGSSALF